MAGEASGANLPYAARYVSNKDQYTVCAKCNKKLDQGVILGHREFCSTGLHTDRWFHPACFFIEMRVKNEDVQELAFRGMGCLKWGDQELIREQIDEYHNGPSPSDTRPRQSFSAVKAEHAKSGRGKCGTCKGLIKEAEAKYQCRNAFHHLGCFMTTDTVFQGSLESIQGYSGLKQEAKDELKKAYEAYKVATRKVKGEVKAETKAEADPFTPTSSAILMGNWLSGGTTTTGAPEDAGEGAAASSSGAGSAEDDPILAAARRVAVRRANDALAAGAAAEPAAAAAAASTSTSSTSHVRQKAADVTIDDDDEIQLVDVVKSEKPPVVMIGMEMEMEVELKKKKKVEKEKKEPVVPPAPVVAPPPPEPAVPSNSLNDLFARFQKSKAERNSLSSVMESMAKKPRIEDEELGKEELIEQLKKQSDALWELREAFEGVRDHDIHELMRTNDMYIPNDHDKLVMHIADAAVFGAPGQCPKCPDGRLMFNSDMNTYVCMGDVTEWTKCTYTNRNPTRSPLGIPRALGERFARVQTTGMMNSMPRRYYQVGAGEVVKNGATIAMAVSAELAEGETSKNIRIHTTASAPASRFTQALTMAAAYLPASMLPASAAAATGPTSVIAGKQFIKRGTVVDGECTVASETHVYRDEQGTLFSCSLTQADMATNRNSYFKMQLLQHDVDSNRFYVFKSWGRVGTELGGSETDPFSDLQDAKSEFLRTFSEKTGNIWADKKYFRKRPGKMAMVDMDYSEIEKEKSDEVAPGSITRLEKPVQNLVLRIFDKDMFKSALRSFDLDMEQMPLGKLSKRQLTSAYAVLNELQTLRQSASVDRALVIDWSNRFYSLIPHNFGHKPPEMLDTKEIIEKKSKLIENLMDIAIAVDLMNEGERKEVKMGVMAMDPIDSKYLTLRSEITVLPKTSPDYKLIEKYAKNTHGSTHFTKIKITDIFRVDRQGEEMRFKHDLGNRMLLWHGSRLSNYVGIISQGLRIAPPEAPHAGYMFGKGIYFADMISKSANYCHPDLSQNDAFLLLCDVALGVIQEEGNATGNNPLKNGNTAVKGLGHQFPNPAEAQFHGDGYVVPCGKAMRGQKIYLEYNEYIVYDMAQVRIKYLVRTQMHYR